MLNATPDDMQNRIDRLEGLVLSLMNNGAQSAGPTAAAGSASNPSSGSLGQNLDSDLDGSQLLDGVQSYGGEGYESETEKVTKSFGVMKVDQEKQKTFYFGEAHWASLLHDLSAQIADVRNYWACHKQQFEEQQQKIEQFRKATKHDVGSALLFGTTSPPSRDEIMSQVPSRYACDMLIARYFNTYDPATRKSHSGGCLLDTADSIRHPPLAYFPETGEDTDPYLKNRHTDNSPQVQLTLARSIPNVDCMDSYALCHDAVSHALLDAGGRCARRV